MNDETLRRRIAQKVTDSSKMSLSLHARQQMSRRNVTSRQVLEVLRKGYVIEHAHQNIKGHWQCTLEAQVAGDMVRVAAALMTDPRGEWVVVITVMN